MTMRRLRRGAAVCLAFLVMINSILGYGPAFPMLSYADERQASVNATTLNIRSGPGTGYSVVDKLTNGAPVVVLNETGGTDGKVWYQIRFSGSTGAEKTGYARSDLIRFPVAYTNDADFEAYLSAQGFPESYKTGLRQLHAMYPNWVFTAQHTNLDWNTVIENESLVGRNLVYNGSISSWKSTADGAYDWVNSTWPSFDSGSYVAASPALIAYYMDPRNFLDDKYVFQFLLHSYDASAHTAEGLSSMLQGTFMEGSAGASYGAPGVSSGTGTSSGGPGTTAGSGASLSGPGAGNGGTASDSSSGTAGTVSGNPAPESGAPDTGVQTGTAPGGGSSGNGSEVQTGVAPGSSFSSAQPAAAGGPAATGKSGVSFQAPGTASSSAGGSLSGGRILASAGDLIGKRILLSLAPGNTQGPSASSDSSNPYAGGPGVAPGTGYSSGSSSPTGSGAPSADYVTIIMNAGIESGVNPYVLAAMIIQEQGTEGKSGSISGTYSGYSGYYNFFNIEAYRTDTMEAQERGLWYASQSGSYGRPWNSVQRSISGGALYYGTNYVKVGQDTFYLKKFNVQGNNLYKHQYMTNIQGAASEGAKLSDAYSSQLKQTALEFKIPVFSNMPASACPKPTVDGSPNNKLSGIWIDGFALTPTFSPNTTVYDLIVNSSVEAVHVSASAYSSTAAISGLGDISLQSGINEIRISVKAQNGDVREYVIRIVRKADGPTYNSAVGSGGSSAGPGGDYSGGPGVMAGPGASSQGTSDGSAAGPGASSGGSGSSAAGPGTAGGPGSSSGPGGSNVTVVP